MDSKTLQIFLQASANMGNGLDLYELFLLDSFLILQVEQYQLESELFLTAYFLSSILTKIDFYLFYQTKVLT